VNFNKADFLTAYGLSSQLPPSQLPEVVFAGRSNVGKSSTINKVLNRKSLARVSAVPGKTITINFFDVDHQLHLVDLPGYGYAKVSKSEKNRWAVLMDKYFNSDRNIALVVQLIDMRHPPTQLDLDMVNYLIQCELPFVVVLTKSDKLNKTQTAQRLEQIKTELPCGDDIIFVPFSSQNGQGVETLRQLICEACGLEA
jgi:GTP-binding protein